MPDDISVLIHRFRHSESVIKAVAATDVRNRPQVISVGRRSQDQAEASATAAPASESIDSDVEGEGAEAEGGFREQGCSAGSRRGGACIGSSAKWGWARKRAVVALELALIAGGLYLLSKGMAGRERCSERSPAPAA